MGWEVDSMATRRSFDSAPELDALEERTIEAARTLALGHDTVRKWFWLQDMTDGTLHYKFEDPDAGGVWLYWKDADGCAWRSKLGKRRLMRILLSAYRNGAQN